MQEITIRLDAFEGPLDLLYHLIEKNEIDIYDIPIAALTEQYLAYLDAAEDRNMDGMSEFLVMAATLLEIKSKMLLPIPKKEEVQEAKELRKVQVLLILDIEEKYSLLLQILQIITWFLGIKIPILQMLEPNFKNGKV